MAFQGNSIYWVEVEKVVPNPFQPRREFDEAKLKELAESIRMYGVLQPMTVTRREIQREDGAFYSEYELIAGERRLRASRLAGLSQVPVIIRDGEQSEQEKLELAIIENLQREDLNAVDRALAFQQLADTFKLSHAKVAEKVGRSREYVSNTIRLLALPEYMLDGLRRGDISEGHARTLLMLNDRPEEQDTVFREILMKKLSVREVERIARKIAHDKVRKKDWINTDPELIEIERRFTESLGTRVQIQKTDFGGKLTIDYFSVDDLEVMLKRLVIEQRELSRQEEAVGESPTSVTESTTVIRRMADMNPEEAAEPIAQSGYVAREIDDAHMTHSQVEALERAIGGGAFEPQPQSQQPVSSENEPMADAEAASELQWPNDYDELSSGDEFPTTDAPAEGEVSLSEEVVHRAEQPAAPERPSFINPQELREKDADESDLYSIRKFSL